MDLEPSGSLPVVRDVDADVEARGEPDADPYVIAGWDARARRPGLPARTRRAARVVAEGLFAQPSGPPPAERLDYLERDLDDFFGHVSLRARLLFRACVATMFWIAPLLVGRFSTMDRLSVDERVEALEKLERTPLSLALLGAKAILCIVYYEHPDAAADIGWDRECMGPRP